MQEFKIENVDDYLFLRKYKKEQLSILRKMYPELSNSEINSVQNYMIRKKLVNPKATLVNNYENKSVDVDLLTVVDWIDKVKPICAGFGCFFKRHDQEINVNGQMLTKFLARRKYYKNQLEDHDPDSDEYATLDRLQLTEKILVNSFYGAGGCPTSQFFNLYTASSITSTGTSLISTTNSSFEYFLSNNNPFYDLDECMNYLQKIETKERNMDYKSILEPVDVDTLYEYLKSLFLEWKDEYGFILRRVISNMTKEERTRAYYINNFFEFSKLPKIYNKIKNVLNKIEYEDESKMSEDEVKTNGFKNPNKPPKNIKNDLEVLWELYKEFVMYESFAYDRINRLKTIKRRSVVAIDTDSNMINFEPFVDFTLKMVEEDDYTNNMDKINIIFASVNTLAFIVTKFVTHILGLYTSVAGIQDPEMAAKINMKNEFLFTKQILANVKKRYISNIALREGVYLPKGKLDVKGHDFIKSATSDELKDKYMDIVKRRLIELDGVDIKGLLNDIRDLEREIKDSLKSGDKKYYSIANVKPPEAYKDPFGQQGFLGVLAWNTAYPNDPVVLPEKAALVKVKLKKIEDAETYIKDNEPVVFENLKKGIYELNGGAEAERIRKKGVYVIAMPFASEVPQWIIDSIDYDEMTNSILKKFYPVIESLGVRIFRNSKRHNYSNILEI